LTRRMISSHRSTLLSLRASMHLTCLKPSRSGNTALTCIAPRPRPSHCPGRNGATATRAIASPGRDFRFWPLTTGQIQAIDRRFRRGTDMRGATSLPAPTRLTPSRHHAAKFAALREGTSSTLVSPATMPSPGLGKAMKRRPGAGGKTSRAARHAATTRSYPKNFCLVDRSEPLRLLFRPASHPFHRYGPSANWQAENQLRELR
jgi:hypothetical protein